MYYVSVVFCIVVYAYFCKTNNIPWRDSYCYLSYDNNGFTVLSLLFCVTFLAIPIFNLIIITSLAACYIRSHYWAKIAKILNKRLL